MKIVTSSDVPSLSTLPRLLLEKMHAAGHAVLECERAFAEAGTNAVAELLPRSGEFYQWDHYPQGDVYCNDSHGQYYYHAHAPGDRGHAWGEEHGHFHTFLRPPGFPPAFRAADVSEDDGAPTHLVAISMGFDGQPIRLFTTNQWVTGETWYEAPDITRLLESFHIGSGGPSPTVNRWISNMLTLFGPTIEVLLHARDEVLSSHTPNPDVHACKDRNMEVTSIADIDVRSQFTDIEAALVA